MTFSSFPRLVAPVVLLFSAAMPTFANSGPEIFDGPPAAYEPLVGEPAYPVASNVVRTISVEERAGVRRDGDLVRVPVFFAEHECAKLDQLELVSSAGDESSDPIVWQADDVRHGPDGGISRVHLWFPVTINAGEKRHYKLIHRSHPAQKSTSPTMSVDAEGGMIRVKTDAGGISFGAEGELRTVAGLGGEWNFGTAGAFPRALVTLPATNGVPATKVALDRTTTERSVDWAAGPLFTKVRVRLGGPEGVSLEQTYRIARDGKEIVITRTVFPGKTKGSEVKENCFLEGTVKGPAGEVSLVRIPAGLRFALRAEHAYSLTALTDTTGQASLLAVPLVLGSGNGSFKLTESAAFTLQGQGGLQRGGEGEKETLYGYWSEVRLVPTNTKDSVELWKTYRAHVQPLVAVVDEPGANVERLHAALADIANEMKAVGWRQDAGRALMLGQIDRMKKLVPRTAASKEANVENLVAGAVASTAQLTKNGQRKLREDEKGRAYGGLDPYHITYTQSAAAAIAVLADAPPAVNAVNLAMATGVRQVGGGVDANGFPYIDCFSRTLNMQLGPVLFGLTAGSAAGQTELAQFYRDLANAPPVQATFGRAQRPYTGAPATSPDQTDFLYQSICDFWLRTTEVLANENLKLQPLMYARYTDCIDVMADVYHGVAARDKSDAVGLARANFFRGQSHTHRWLGWSAAPFIRLLEDPAEKGQIGVTEATHFARAMKGRWKNWPDLTFYILADVLVREGLQKSSMPLLPAGPANVSIKRSGEQTDLSWDRVNGAAEYRIYRTKSAGGPYTWLNSPYVKDAAGSTKEPHYTDSSAPPDAAYVVTAVDANGRESAWPEWP